MDLRKILITTLLGSQILLGGCLGKSESSVQAASSNNSSPFTSGAGVPIRWSTSTLGGSGLDVRNSDSIDAFFVLADEVGGLDPSEQMAKAWNDSIGSLTFFRVPFNDLDDAVETNLEHADISDYEDGNFVIYRHNTWFNNVSSTALAVTQWLGTRKNVGSASEHIELFEADIIFNFADFTFTTDSGNTADFDFHTVLLHEMGHFIGLSHYFGSESSVMTSFIGPSDVIRSVQPIDVDAIEFNYGISALMAAPGATSGTSGLMASAATSGSTATEGQVVRGLMELHSDGSCVHKFEGHEISRHQVDLRRPH